MADYERILVALDFSSVAEKLMARARRMTEQFQAQPLLLHVVEYIPPLDPSGDMMSAPLWDVDEQELVKAAERKLTALAEQQGLSDCRREVLIGSAKREIAKCAADWQCDLIIIGSHGRQGIGRLLGSTAVGVLHRAHCDVLAVRAEEDA